MVDARAACLTKGSTLSNAEPDAGTADDDCFVVDCNPYDCSDSANNPDGPGSGGGGSCPAGSLHCYTVGTSNLIDCVWYQGQTTMTCSCQDDGDGGAFDLPQSSDKALIAKLWTQHCHGRCLNSTTNNDASQDLDAGLVAD